MFSLRVYLSITPFILYFPSYYFQGIKNLDIEEQRARESHGKDVNTALKNNIEAIILKWSYQVND